MIDIDKLYNYLNTHEGQPIILDKEHMIVRRILDIDEEQLLDYIELLNKAKEQGVNIINVVDFQILNIKKKGKSNLVNGIYVLNRSLGTTYPNTRRIKVNIFDNVIKKCNEYFKQNRLYLEELENRSNAPQEQYDKLVNDIIKLHLLGIKQSNTLYNIKEGFTISDGIYPIEDNTYHSITNEVIDAIMGKGRPYMIVNDCFIECLPEHYSFRYNILYETIIPKIIKAFIKNGIHPDYITKVITNNNGLLNYNGYIAQNKEDIYRLIIKNDKIRIR
jgi:hypothetical protein